MAFFDIDSIFTYHPADTDELRTVHAAVRDVCKFAATDLLSITPQCAEQTLMIRHLQQAMMFANSAIAQFGAGGGGGAGKPSGA